MSTRHYVKDPRWAKIAQELFAAHMSAERSYRRLSRAWYCFAKLVRYSKTLKRRQQKREAELDAEQQQRKEVPS